MRRLLARETQSAIFYFPLITNMLFLYSLSQFNFFHKYLIIPGHFLSVSPPTLTQKYTHAVPSLIIFVEQTKMISS